MKRPDRSEPELVALGDRAWRFALPASVDRRALLHALRAAPSIIDVVLAEDLGAAVVADARSLAPAARAVRAALGDLAPAARAVRAALGDLAPAAGDPPRPVRTVSVVYEGEDLVHVARMASLTVEDVVALHVHREYEVTMVGFMPGFAYLRGLDPRLVLARRETPRTRVPARSVALAAGYTGIYPFASPGGWHLLGQAVDFVPFDAGGAALAVGDRVRFEQVKGAGAQPSRKVGPPSSPLPGASSRAAGAGARQLEVRAARGPALIVDSGRTGHMHEGVPHGGPMVESGLARANAAAGNAPGTTGVEIYGALELVAHGAGILVADDVRGARALEDGEVFAVAAKRGARVRYLAVSGGLDVPSVLGGRGTMLAAGLGGFEGRLLSKGDHLALGREGQGLRQETAAGTRETGRSPRAVDERTDPEAERTPTGAERPVTTVAILAGPDATDDVLAAVVGADFVVASASDRTGSRLTGPALPTEASPLATRERRSAPMVRGAIELTPSGLIVLGPDHPTTGGYPVIAVVRSEAMDALFATPPGGRVRFSLAPA